MCFTKKIMSIFLLFILIFTMPFITNQTQSDAILPTDLEQLPYQQDILISIDTSLPEAAYQPIDMRIMFDHACWAQNETIHSVRIGYTLQSETIELESQIYDLTYTDETHISACSIVFLIPIEATGEETYTVYYSDSQTEQPSYPDHLSILDTHYYYEPITGQIIDFDYYQITEDEFIIYGICTQGELLANGMSNTAIKLLPQSTEFKTKNAEQIASFYTTRSIEPSGEHMGTQWAEGVTKSILVDGNLMIRIQIKGISPDDALKSDNIYTYYYRPTETKSLHVNLNHEVLQDISVTGTQQKVGTYCSLSTIKARSGTIEDMNIGNILPKIHFYTEDDTIREYDIPTDPEADPADWLLGTNDDQDLGSKAWLCIDDSTTGQAHGLIFETNTGIVEGEHDGIQVKSSVQQHVKLPGLEADTGDVFAMRNAYENGNHNTELPKGLNISFNVQYMASQNGGYQAIDNESIIYQSLIKNRPINRGNGTIDTPTEETERYTLKAAIHLEPSFPLGPLLSAATGKNFSYLTAELYRDDALASSGSASRLKLGDINIEFGEEDTIIQKIRTVLNIFDIRNSTFFKTIQFPDLEPGTYLIKIYKENPRRASERLYVGYTIVEVTENTTTHIYCKPQTSLEAIVLDQKEHGVSAVDIQIVSNEVMIAHAITSDEGKATISFPLDTRSDFIMKSYYHGFLIQEQTLSLNVFNRWRDMTETIEIELYDVTINVLDTLGLVPAVDLNPTMTSTNMQEKKTLSAEKIDMGTYHFTDLLKESYNLKLSYKSFELFESVSINKDTTLDLQFPAEFTLDLTILNTLGDSIDTAQIILDREGQGPKIQASQGIASVSVPPGSYEMTIQVDETDIAKQMIEIKGDKQIDIVSKSEPFTHTLLSIILIVLGAIFSIFLWVKQKKLLAIHVLIVFILLASLFQPWWHLAGDLGSIQTQTNTYLYPTRIITLTESPEIIGGELSEAPEEFIMVLELISLALILGGVISLVGTLLRTKHPKISFVISILSIIFILLCAVLFFVAMTEVTKVGVGQFFGSGDISVSIPGETQKMTIACTWGAGSGLYLLLIGFIGLLIVPLIPLLRRFGISLKSIPF